MPSDATFLEVKNAFQSIAGLESLSSADEFFLTSSLNSAVQRAYNESDSWPRYLVVGEERLLIDDQIVPYASGCNCTDLLAASEEKVDCLESILAPQKLNGVDAWTHSASSTKPSYPSDPTCTTQIESSVSLKFIEMNGSNATLEWTRVNNDPACQASGSINWVISPNQSGTPNFGPPWSGSRGDTTVVNKDYAPGKYYVYAYGVNLNGNVFGETYQSKGSFTVSATGEIAKTIEVTNTIVEGSAGPCV
jgi:hypothetical protein